MCRIGIRLNWNKLVQEVLYYEKRMILCQNMYKHNEIMICFKQWLSYLIVVVRQIGEY